MSRIGDALKRAGAPDITDGLLDLPLAATAAATPFQHVVEAPEPDTRDADAPEPSLQNPALAAGRPAPFNGAPVRTDSRLVVNPEVPAVAIEQYRRLAATLHHLQEDRDVKRVLISSAVADEGKTLTSTNLALTLSQSYAKRVLLIDADLRRPRVNVMFDLPTGPGLSEALDRRDPGRLPIAQVSPLLWILPAGRATPDPIAGLTSSRMAAIIDEAAEKFDWVIVDTPPVGLLSDARLVASMVDAALLVVGAHSTPCAVVQRAVEVLGRDRVLGVVLNRVADGEAAGGQYHYYYGQYGHSDHRDDKRGLFARMLGRR